MVRSLTQEAISVLLILIIGAAPLGCVSTRSIDTTAAQVTEAFKTRVDSLERTTGSGVEQIELLRKDLREIVPQAANRLDAVLAGFAQRVHSSGVGLTENARRHKLRVSLLSLSSWIEKNGVYPPYVSSIEPREIDLNANDSINHGLAGVDLPIDKVRDPDNLRLVADTPRGPVQLPREWLVVNTNAEAVIRVDRERRRTLHELQATAVSLVTGQGDGFPICVLGVRPFEPKTTTVTLRGKVLPFFVPPHVEGDRDFGAANGTYVRMRMRVILEAAERPDGRDELRAKVWMSAAEFRNGRPFGDRTRAEGWSDWIWVETFDGGLKVVQLAGVTGRSADTGEITLDAGETLPPERFRTHAGDNRVVRFFDYVADTHGPESGTRTGVKARLEDIDVELLRSLPE